VETLSELDLVIINVGQISFGVDVEQIIEIVSSAQVERSSQLPSFVEGTINFRKENLPVIDLARRFGLTEPNNELPIITVEMKGKMVGIRVSSVAEVLKLALDDVEPLPRLVEQQIEADCIWGLGKLGEELIILLNLDEVLSEVEIAQLPEA
jgi:purine-binding chemotaxis protein CheW